MIVDENNWVVAEEVPGILNGIEDVVKYVDEL